MDIALEQASLGEKLGEVPIGAVITFNNDIIAKAYNQVETLKDPTAHAEIIVIKEAAKLLNNKVLNECTLFVTLEPCSMCSGAIVLAKLNTLVYGASDIKTGASGSIYCITHDSRLNHQVNIIQGIREKECSMMLKNYFKNKR